MKYKILFILAAMLIAGVFLVSTTKTQTKTSYYNKQLEAANKTQAAFAILKAKREELNIPIDEKLDPLKSGLIGQKQTIREYSITTSLGSLEAKQTSLNPNFTSLIISYLKSLKLQTNDSVAVNFSSSFPALNIAVIIALDTLDLNYYIISSLGASTYGANIVGFNYLVMEEELYEKGIIKRKTAAMSLGGDNDNLSNVLGNDQEFINSLYDKYNYLQQIKEPNLEKNVKQRLSLYKNNLNKIKAFINVGGNTSSRGSGIKDYNNGIIKPRKIKINKSSGLIDYFLNDGVSVINLLNIIDLAKKNNLQVFNRQEYAVGVGACYYESKYNKSLITVIIFIAISLIVIDYENRNYQSILKELIQING